MSTRRRRSSGDLLGWSGGGPYVLADERALRDDWSQTLAQARAGLDRARWEGSAPPVRIWHGTKDRTIPVTVGRAMAVDLAAELVEDPEAGHLGAVLRHTGDITALLGAAAR